MIKLSKEKVMLLHEMLAKQTGGSTGIRDTDLLESALESAYQTFGGVELYPSVEEKGAWLGYALISNHAFVDGNKRIGLLTMLTFLEVNGVKLNYTDDELIDLGLSLAKNSKTYENLVEWIKSHQN